MLGVILQETRVYQEAKAEGKLEILLMLLNHNLGTLPASLTEQIETLSIAPLAPKAIEQLEALCAVAFDFQSLTDLTSWLSA